MSVCFHFMKPIEVRNSIWGNGLVWLHHTPDHIGRVGVKISQSLPLYSARLTVNPLVLYTSYDCSIQTLSTNVTRTFHLYLQYSTGSSGDDWWLQYWKETSKTRFIDETYLRYECVSPFAVLICYSRQDR